MPVEPRRLGPRGGPAVRRHEDHAHMVRRRQDRLPHAAHVVPDIFKYPSIKRFDEYYTTDLMVDDGACYGCTAIEMRTGEMRLFRGKAVIICTGGAGRIFPFTTNGAIKTGDGMAMAYRAGVPLKDMEFVQYHPTGLPGSGILLTEGCRGEGGYMLNKDNYRYLQDYGLGPATPKPVLKSMELGPRDRLSQAFWQESKKGRTVQTKWGDIVWLDMRHLGEKLINERLPLVRDLSISYVAADPVTDLVPVRPVVHYMMGGIHTDINAATPIAGLYAAGECACVSINGANRLGSNSLGELLVFGARAAASPWSTRRRSRRRPMASSPARRPTPRTGSRRCSSAPAAPSGWRRCARDDHALEEGCGISRREVAAGDLQGHRRCPRPLHQGGARGQELVFNTDLYQTLELGAMIQCAETVALSACPQGIARRASAPRLREAGRYELA